MTLGDRIRQCRLEAKLSQEKVAELVGVSRQAVTKWETNQSAPSTDNLFKLAEILGTTVDYLASPQGQESLSLAGQIHLLYKEEEAKQQQQLLREQRANRRTAVGILLGYLAVFLTGRIIGGDFSHDYTLKSWLFDTDPARTSYLYGWLLSSYTFLFASIASTLPALFGKRCCSVVSMVGFMLALPLGEFFGRNPYCTWEHWGWAIWLLIFLEFFLLGGILQRIWHNKPDLRSKWFILLISASIAGTAIIILFFRLNMGPCPS